MKNYKRRLVYLGVAGVIIIVTSLYFYLQLMAQGELPDQTPRTKGRYDNLLLQSSELQRVWWEGEQSKEWERVKTSCLQKLKVTEKFDESLLRCNPILVECINQFLKKKPYNLNPKKTYQYISKTQSNLLGIENGGFVFNLIDPSTGQNIDVLLKDNCRESYLDQRVYAYGEMPNKKEGDDYLFDNLNQNIYVDRSLVINAELNEWIKFGEASDIKDLVLRVGNYLFQPATNLTLKQMEEYCIYKGKELMAAHIFDAATFLPMDLENKTPDKVQRSPYFWSKKNKEKLGQCENIFSKECLEKNHFRTNSVFPTWAGVYDSMGGVMEAFKNPIEPYKNLKVSSFYLPINSSWHRLGRRSHWDGEGFQLRNFDLKNNEIDPRINEIKVGFRCMRRVR